MRWTVQQEFATANPAWIRLADGPSGYWERDRTKRRWRLHPSGYAPAHRFKAA
jgi:hypothetical protein